MKHHHRTEEKDETRMVLQDPRKALEKKGIQLEREITRREKAEEARQESEVLFRTLCSTSHDAIILINSEGNVSFWNEAAERIFGYSAAEALNADLHALLVPTRYHALYHRELPRFQLTGEGALIGTTTEFTATCKDGREFPVELSLASVRLQGGWHAIGIVKDISQTKKLESELRQLAIVDPLTNTYTQRYFFPFADREFERARRYGHNISIIMLLVDHFENLSSTHGYAATDQVLSVIASRCQGTLREIDIFARYSEHGFVLLMPETDPRQALQVANRLRKLISTKPIEIEADSLSATISLGVASTTGNKIFSLDKLIEQAEQALNQSGVEDHNRVSVWREDSNLDNLEK